MTPPPAARPRRAGAAPWLLCLAAGAALAWGTDGRGGGKTGAAGTPAPRPSERLVRAMATNGRLLAFPGPGMAAAEAERALDRAVEAIRRVERLMGPYDPGSDVRRLNEAGPGEWVGVDPLTWRVVMEALRVHALTDGAFDPTVGPLKRLYFTPRPAGGLAPGEEPEPDPPWPSAREAALAAGSVGAGGLRFDTEGRRLAFEKPGMLLDLSALAKGFAVDEAARALEAAGIRDALVELGGEVRLMGGVPRGPEPPGTAGGAGNGGSLRPGRRPWNLQIAHPRGGEALALVSRTACAAATSGDAGHGREREGARHSHIFDPRTGLPLSGGLVGVTVLLPGPCLLADALATALCVLGPEGAERFLGQRADDLFRDGVEVWWAWEDPRRPDLRIDRLLVPGPGLEATGARSLSPRPARVWTDPPGAFVPADETASVGK